MWFTLIAKYWKYGLAILLALAAVGVVLHYRHTLAENQKLQVEVERQAADLEAAKAAAENARKARQVREKNVQKANIPDADVIAILAREQWLRD